MLNYYPTILSAMGSYKLAGEELLGRYMLLCLFCAQSDFDDGVIKDCKKWKRDQWKIAVGVRKAPTNDTKLWHWEGEDLHLDFFGTKYIEGCRARSKHASDASNSKKKGTDGTETTKESGGAREPAQAPAREDAQAPAREDAINKINEINEMKENKNQIQPKPAPVEDEGDGVEDGEVNLHRPGSVDDVAFVMQLAVSEATPEQVAKWAGTFYTEKEAAGWMWNNEPIKDWQGLAMSYAKACYNRQKNTGKSVPPSREGLAPGETDRNRNIY